MLTNTFRALVNNLFKKKNLWEKKKKVMIILTVFFVSQKSSVKTFLK